MRNLTLALLLLFVVGIAMAGDGWFDIRNVQLSKHDRSWYRLNIPYKGGSGKYSYDYYDYPERWKYENNYLYVPYGYSYGRYNTKVRVFDQGTRRSHTQTLTFELGNNRASVYDKGYDYYRDYDYGWPLNYERNDYYNNDRYDAYENTYDYDGGYSYNYQKDYFPDNYYGYYNSNRSSYYGDLNFYKPEYCTYRDYDYSLDYNSDSYYVRNGELYLPSWSSVEVLIKRGSFSQIRQILTQVTRRKYSCTDKTYFLTGTWNRFGKYIDYSRGYSNLKSSVSYYEETLSGLRKTFDSNYYSCYDAKIDRGLYDNYGYTSYLSSDYFGNYLGRNYGDLGRNLKLGVSSVGLKDISLYSNNWHSGYGRYYNFDRNIFNDQYEWDRTQSLYAYRGKINRISKNVIYATGYDNKDYTLNFGSYSRLHGVGLDLPKAGNSIYWSGYKTGGYGYNCYNALVF